MTLAALALAAPLAGCGWRGAGSNTSTAGVVTEASGFAGASLPSAPRAPEFTLRDQRGGPASLAQLRGQVALLAFVSATCGRSCVLVADQIRGALDELAHPVPALLVSLDPSADSAARSAAFLARTGLAGRARYLSGPPGALARVWSAYRLHRDPHVREPTPRVYLLDRARRERVLYELEQLTPEALAHDISRLEDEGR